MRSRGIRFHHHAILNFSTDPTFSVKMLTKKVKSTGIRFDLNAIRNLCADHTFLWRVLIYYTKNKKCELANSKTGKIFTRLIEKYQESFAIRATFV